MKYILLSIVIVVSSAGASQFQDRVDSSCYRSYIARAKSMARINQLTESEDLSGIYKEIFILRGHSLACMQHCKSKVIQETSSDYLKFTMDVEKAFIKNKKKKGKK